jgi:hypothetical protein
VLRSVTFLLVAACANAFAKEPKQTPEADAKFVGAVGCRSSSCHGGAGEKRSQYITWSQKDFHTRAYAILLDARSARIGEALGIPQPQSSARCTVCHSPFQAVTQTRLTSTARPDEGVSCESCHGAAERWLRGHTRTDWSYTTRVSAGMHDLRNLYVRANACVACHQNVDADILKAGHPELVFELDSQSVNEPKHWREDDPWNGAKSWLIGQAVALREICWADSQPSLNPTTAARDQLLAQQDALVWILDKTDFVKETRNKPSLAQMSYIGGIQLRADEIAQRASQMTWTTQSVRDLLITLASSESDFGKRGDKSLPEMAKRLTLALESLTRALNANGGALKVDNELAALRLDVQRHYDFDVAAFAEHLRAFHAKL